MIYNIRARYLPTLLTVPPLCLFMYQILNYFDFDVFYNNGWVLKFTYYTGLLSASSYLMLLFNRNVSKTLFERGNLMTTTMLSNFNNDIDPNTKQKIKSKVKYLYDLDVPSLEFEKTDKKNADKQNAIIVSQIRNSLRGNHILFQRNIEYGFSRNLRGGSVISLLISLILIVFTRLNSDYIFLKLSLLSMIIYLIVFAIASYMQKSTSKYYSNTLFEQFLSFEKK